MSNLVLTLCTTLLQLLPFTQFYALIIDVGYIYKHKHMQKQKQKPMGIVSGVMN